MPTRARRTGCSAGGGGEQRAWEQLLDRHRDRLRRMVALRLDRRLQGRVDASDVIQEASLEAVRRLPEYLKNPTMPFLPVATLPDGTAAHGAAPDPPGGEARDAGREVALFRELLPEATSAALAAQLLGRLTTPSEAAVRAERRIRMQEALNAMDPIDREVLALRHYEQLSNSEVATILGLDRSASSKRYVRALVRLKEFLAGLPGGLEEA